MFTPVSRAGDVAAPAAVRRAAPLARTGGDIVRWTMVAFGLMGVGFLFYVGAHRRPLFRS